jgi:uncharacterized damage-inducible protein DinB
MTTFFVEPVAGCHPEIGRWLAILDDTRERTLHSLRRLAEADLDAAPAAGVNTIGMLLYHIAITDLDWCYDNLLQQPYPANIAPLFPYPLLDEQQRLYPVVGWDAAAYHLRLEAARAKVHAVFKPLSGSDFYQLVERSQEGFSFKLSPESILRHLAQHEAEHRGEIHILLDALGH